MYHIGCATVNQFTTNIFARLPTTGQDTSTFLDMITNGLKTTK